MYTEGDDAWPVLHNSLYARFRDDMEDVVPSTGLPTFDESPYSPEPYLEGAYVIKYGGKYYLVQSASDRASMTPPCPASFAWNGPGPRATASMSNAATAAARSLTEGATDADATHPTSL